MGGEKIKRYVRFECNSGVDLNVFVSAALCPVILSDDSHGGDSYTPVTVSVWQASTTDESTTHSIALNEAPRPQRKKPSSGAEQEHHIVSFFGWFLQLF